LRAELYNDIPLKDLGEVRKVPIQWEEYIQVFEAVLLLKHTQSISSGMEGDEDPLPHHIYIYISIITIISKDSFFAATK